MCCMCLLWLLRGNEGDGATAAAKLRGRAAAAAAESTAAAKLHGWGGTTAAAAVGLLLLLPPDEELLLGEGAALAAYTAPAADMKDGGRVIWCLVPAIRPRRNGDRPAARRARGGAANCQGPHFTSNATGADAWCNITIQPVRPQVHRQSLGALWLALRHLHGKAEALGGCSPPRPPPARLMPPAGRNRTDAPGKSCAAAGNADRFAASAHKPTVECQPEDRGLSPPARPHWRSAPHFAPFAGCTTAAAPLLDQLRCVA